MLVHLNSEPRFAERTVVIGSAGFVGSAIVRWLEAHRAPTLPLSRRDVDLQAPGAAAALGALLRPTDAVVCVSALAPVKDAAMLRDNVTIIEALAEAIRARPVAHVLNIGSDAIYGDRGEPIDEAFEARPTSLHGVMHLTREILLGEASGDTPFATLRPTLIYGEHDPHNGYGPNRFRRLAAAGSPIALFGEGEEQRDHVWIEDVADLAVRILSWRSRGALNAATGTLVSFRQLAEAVASHFAATVRIEGTPRTGPMPHGGYRAFDPAATFKAFPDFRYTQPLEGIAKVHIATA